MLLLVNNVNLIRSLFDFKNRFFFCWTLFELLQWSLSLTKYRSKLIGNKSLVNTIAWYFEIFKILINELIKRNLKLINDYFIHLTAWNRYYLSIKEEICGMKPKNLCQEKLWKNHSHRNICTFLWLRYRCMNELKFI
jgi:hypothetical protein